ncbi:MAG: hypothetical protein JWO02_462 [Solirubrobacterales bacterium]|nr:hypothetical protein [Solirubrobacterales bacterium]
MRNRIIGMAVVGIATLGAAGGVAAASGSSAAAGGSRLDDGKELLAEATITEQQAITAAQGAAKGDLNEVDLEQYSGRLVFNVDVGSHDVKVDAGSGQVLAVSQDD